MVQSTQEIARLGRRTLIDIAQRRQRPGSGSLPEPLRRMPTTPYLILSKLYAGRVQDIADITRILGGADDASLERTRAVILRHSPDMAEDLESLIELGRLEAQG